MKRNYLFGAMCLSIATFISSCNNEEGAKTNSVPPVIFTAEYDYTMYLCSGDSLDFKYLQNEGPSVVDVERTPLTYDNMALFAAVIVDRDTDFDVDDEIALQNETIGKYMHQSRQYIISNTEWTENHKIWPGDFSTISSAIVGDVKISADKTLFGQEPGSNLSAHFNVWSPNACVITANFESPTIIYNAKDYMPTAISEYFVKDSYLAQSYAFYLADKPEENYEEVTFTITIPVEDQYVYDYYHRLELDPKAEMNTMKKDYVTSAKVKFGKISELSDFEKRYDKQSEPFRYYIGTKFVGM